MKTLDAYTLKQLKEAFVSAFGEPMDPEGFDFPTKYDAIEAFKQLLPEEQNEVLDALDKATVICPNCKKECDELDASFCVACEDMNTFDYAGEEFRATMGALPFFLAAF